MVATYSGKSVGKRNTVVTLAQQIMNSDKTLSSSISPSALPELAKLEALVKQAAREELLAEFGHAEYEYKEDGSVITPADLAMQARLEKELQQHWPQYAMLGEEMTEAEQCDVLTHQHGYWCVDPLDGTSNYAAGLPFFAVSIALIIDNRQVLGLIYDPVRDEMFTAIQGSGAWLNGKTLKHKSSHQAGLQHTIAEIDLKRLPTELRLRLVDGNMFSSQRNLGSSAIDWCWLSAGRFDIYLHGGQKLWDYAAGSLIFAEAGGRSISLDDEAVFRGQLETRSVLASFDEQLFKHWYNWINIPV